MLETSSRAIQFVYFRLARFMPTRALFRGAPFGRSINKGQMKRP